MDFEVLIIGTDANAYYMGRCYHEAYGKKARLLGHSVLPYTAFSDIVEVTYDEAIWEEQGFLAAIRRMKNPDAEKTVLISSNETYAGFIAKNRETLLQEGFVFNYPNAELIDTLMYKDRFYKTYADSVLDLPVTVYYDCAAAGEIPDTLTFPVIVKPADVILYNHLTFAGKNKIYKCETRAELEETVKTVVAGGYNGSLILQDFIPGDDSYLFDAVAYCGSDGKVQMLSFAQIGLQEHTRTLVGNAAVLINGYNQFGNTDAVTQKLKSFLETVGYTGFAEFDLKYDPRDQKFKVLEINARQGRSSYYVCPLGCNLVKMTVDDLVYGERPDYGVLKEELLLSFVPKGVIKKYIVNEEYRKKALQLWKKGAVNPLYYRADGNRDRKRFLFKRRLCYFRDYRNSYWRVN